MAVSYTHLICQSAWLIEDFFRNADLSNVRKTDAYHLTEAEIALIITASSLHDIGKVSIPEEILNKPGRLTDEEFKIMKSHSEIGASMIRNMDFPQDKPLVRTAWEICRWHHERWDGRGYPDGLKGEEIPISAQIVSIARCV